MHWLAVGRLWSILMCIELKGRCPLHFPLESGAVVHLMGGLDLCAMTVELDRAKVVSQILRSTEPGTFCQRKGDDRAVAAVVLAADFVVDLLGSGGVKVLPLRVVFPTPDSRWLRNCGLLLLG